MGMVTKSSNGDGLRFLPYVGMVTIILNDYPILKYILLGGMGIMVVFSKDE